MIADIYTYLGSAQKIKRDDLEYINIKTILSSYNNLEPTKSLWLGLKNGDRMSLIEYWMKYLNENRN